MAARKKKGAKRTGKKLTKAQQAERNRAYQKEYRQRRRAARLAEAEDGVRQAHHARAERLMSEAMERRNGRTDHAPLRGGANEGPDHVERYPDTGVEEELGAMRAIVDAIRPLDREARARILGWVNTHYGDA